MPCERSEKGMEFKMKSLLKKSGWMDILVSIVFAIIGIFMIAKTDLAVKIISYVLGGFFIAIGIVKISNYFLSKGNYDFYNYDLIYGIIAIIIGLVTIFCSGLIESTFRIVIALWIIYSGLIRLSFSLKLRVAEISIWNISLVLSIIMIIGGVYILFQNGALILTLGIIMLTYSIMDLIESVIFMKYVDDLLE